MTEKADGKYNMNINLGKINNDKMYSVKELMLIVTCTYAPTLNNFTCLLMLMTDNSVTLVHNMPQLKEKNSAVQKYI